MSFSAWSWAIRNKTRLLDAGVLAALTISAIGIAYEVDVFALQSAETSPTHRIDFAETLAIVALFSGGMAVFAFRRLQDARRETARRLKAEGEARQASLHDPLTGLPNRRQFSEALQAAIESPPRADASHALILMDLNGFKRVNDYFGHGIGDELLIKVATRLRHAKTREGDLMARLGGDEFILLAKHVTGAEAATGLALRVIEALEDPIEIEGIQHRVGVAVGISMTPQDGLDPIELLRKADVALYRAKADKGLSPSSMSFFESEMDVLARERRDVELELREAMSAGQILSFYQPLVDLKDGSVAGFEALARWRSPVLGDVPPDRFITIAEDNGLIAKLTDLLFAQACTDALTWPDHVYLSFNVSSVLLRDRAFPLRILRTLNQTGLSPKRVEFEITESAIVRDMAAAREVMGQLRDLGASIALDDFGTGYSSLYHLRNFKVDRIKIDRSFISSMLEDQGSGAIVRALIGLGAGLGLRVTAEGVEQAEQEALLRDHGCHTGQGYRFSSALDPESASALACRPLAQDDQERVA